MLNGGRTDGISPEFERTESIKKKENLFKEKREDTLDKGTKARHVTTQVDPTRV